MTSTITRPETSAQDVLAMNVNLMISARRIQKRDFAKAISTSPQTIARKLRGEITWTINETVATAKFLNVDVDTLLKPDLTTAELMGTQRDEEWGCSGLNRGPDDYEFDS